MTRSLAALCGPETFAGRAAAVLGPTGFDVVYVENGVTLFRDVRAGDVDAIVVGAGGSVSGCIPGTHALVVAPGADLFVVAECVVPFSSVLLGRRGSALADIRRVSGGLVSLEQVGPFLREHLPGVAIGEYRSPYDAGADVRDGDGSTAVLGAPELGATFGLDVLASGIDGGAVGRFWALGLEPRFDERSDHLLVAMRCDEGGMLGLLLSDLTSVGLAIGHVCASPTGRGFEQDYAITSLRQGVAYPEIQAVVARHPGTRIAGAYTSVAEEP